jgi:hypothetical protein
MKKVMITLPKHISTTMLQSFWIVLWTMVVSLLVIIIYFTLNSLSSFLLILLLPVIILPGYRNPELIIKFYNVFNRLLRVIQRASQKLILWVIYFLYFGTHRVTSQDLQSKIQSAPPSSMWEIKTIENIAGEKTEFDVSLDVNKGTSGLRPLLKWISRSGKWWLFTLVPFILIISFLAEDEAKAAAHDTYTLY